MLLPQYTIRWLLGIMTGTAVICSIFAVAMKGSLWAIGLSVAILTLIAMMLVYAAMFVVIWLVSVVLAAILPSWMPRSRPSDLDVPATPTILE